MRSVIFSRMFSEGFTPLTNRVCIDPLIIGAGIATIGSLIGGAASSQAAAIEDKKAQERQYQYQTKLNQQQEQYALKNSAISNQYQRSLIHDSALLEKSGLVAAGLSPASMSSGSFGTVSGSDAKVDTPSAGAAGSFNSAGEASARNWSDFASDVSQAMLMSAEIQNKQAQTKGQQIDNTFKAAQYEADLENKKALSRQSDSQSTLNAAQEMLQKAVADDRLSQNKWLSETDEFGVSNRTKSNTYDLNAKKYEAYKGNVEYQQEQSKANVSDTVANLSVEQMRQDLQNSIDQNKVLLSQAKLNDAQRAYVVKQTVVAMKQASLLGQQTKAQEIENARNGIKFFIEYSTKEQRLEVERVLNEAAMRGSVPKNAIEEYQDYVANPHKYKDVPFYDLPNVTSAVIWQVITEVLPSYIPFTSGRFEHGSPSVQMEKVYNPYGFTTSTAQ